MTPVYTLLTVTAENAEEAADKAEAMGDDECHIWGHACEPGDEKWSIIPPISIIMPTEDGPVRVLGVCDGKADPTTMSCWGSSIVKADGSDAVPPHLQTTDSRNSEAMATKKQGEGDDCEGQETYYYDPVTGERVTVEYLVTLVAPANYFGYVEVRAISQQEAGRLALDRLGEADWECTRLKLVREHIEVLEIECEDPPEGAVLVQPSRNSENARSDDGDPLAPTQQRDDQE